MELRGRMMLWLLRTRSKLSEAGRGFGMVVLAGLDVLSTLPNADVQCPCKRSDIKSRR